MFDICLFDLDETLVRTDDLKVVREAGKNDQTEQYVIGLKASLATRTDRHIYSIELLRQIRQKFPLMKLGIFTRSPRSYATAVLAWAYAGFQWDFMVAYEDVKPTKPYGDGIDLVMKKFGMLNFASLPRVILVGDGDPDVRSAYNCGCVVALDKSAWPKKFGPEHWGAIDHVADAIIEDPEEIIDVLSNPTDFLPALERALVNNNGSQRAARFDKLGHFVPAAAGGDNTSHPIFVSGRSFANYGSIQHRKSWHVLTKSIEDNKKSIQFPVEWVDTIRSFILLNFAVLFGPDHVVVSSVPYRPGRTPRLENLLVQLAASIAANPIRRITVTCIPDLLAYKEGVKSQHGDYLTRDERFINVRDHLVVQKPELAKAKKTGFLILDDVVTTGASLIFAKKYLNAAGATNVSLLSLAKNVGNLYKK